MQEFERIALDQYHLMVTGTRKVRGAILCNTDQGLFLLKEINVPEERLAALARLYEYLKEQDWCNVDEIVQNKEASYLTAVEGKAKYIVKRWYSGRECDLRKQGEILTATGTLAKLHLLMRKEIEGLNPNSTEAPIKLYERHNRELKKVRRFIRKVSPKGTFEYTFQQNFESMYRWAEAAEELLKDFEYEEYYQKGIEQNCLVHGEYNYHNILMPEAELPETPVAITNFDKAGYGIQMEDLYYFMRKTLEKQGWKERIGDSMLNAYSAVNPLTGKDLEYLKIRFVYPEKFWKTANTYYCSNKAWVSIKNVEKLEMAIRQTKEKDRFLYNIYRYKIE